MTEPCLPLEELLALAESEAGDPRRDHVNHCPRCRSRLTAYGFFTSLDRDDPCPGEGQAVVQLAATLRDRIGSGDLSRAAPARPKARGRSPWWAPRLLVPALGAAAIVAGVVLLVRDQLPSTPSAPALREEPASLREAVVAALPAQVLLDGSLELHWNVVSGADAYRVRLLDAGLEEIARFDAGQGSSFVLTVADLQAWSSRAAFWQVQALAEGDRIADSAPVALPRGRGTGR
jgi:hypothetical protein